MARRSKSQARRSGSGLPGWAWLVLGIVIALVAVMVAPKLLKPEGRDGFVLPRPDPDAQPAVARDDEAGLPAPAAGETAAQPAEPPEREYDFYTLLPGEEVAMSDAELAASARAEEARDRAQDEDAADLAPPAAPARIEPETATAAATAAADNGAHYILQAGAFGASGDAEAVKARIALLGLNARVESAVIKGKTVYRVRMGPYGTATELADAKGRLANGGLPAMAIKVK